MQTEVEQNMQSSMLPEDDMVDMKNEDDFLKQNVQSLTPPIDIEFSSDFQSMIFEENEENEDLLESVKSEEEHQKAHYKEELPVSD